MPHPSRCRRQDCERVLTAGSPSEFFCSPMCAQAWQASGADDLPISTHTRILSDRQSAAEHDLDQAFGWLDARA